jgi:hypothetical protein
MGNRRQRQLTQVTPSAQAAIKTGQIPRSPVVFDDHHFRVAICNGAAFCTGNAALFIMATIDLSVDCRPIN